MNETFIPSIVTVEDIVKGDWIRVGEIQLSVTANKPWFGNPEYRTLLLDHPSPYYTYSMTLTLHQSESIVILTKK